MIAFLIIGVSLYPGGLIAGFNKLIELMCDIGLDETRQLPIMRASPNGLGEDVKLR